MTQLIESYEEDADLNQVISELAINPMGPHEFARARLAEVQRKVDSRLSWRPQETDLQGIA